MNVNISRYIVKNCPAREDIYACEFDADGNLYQKMDTPNYCVKHKKICDEISDCIIKKQIYWLRDKILNCDKQLACSECLSNGECVSEYAGDLLKNWQIEEVKNNAG